MLGIMLCNQCNEREATIHITHIVGDKMTKRDLCEVCGKELTDIAKRGEYIPLDALTSDDAMETMLTLMVASDPRYPKAAYLFVQEGLSRAQKMFWEPGTSPHMSGAQLLDGLRELAIESFGKRAKAQLNSWGIFKCEDIGEIIFNLIEAKLLVKQEGDSKADFQSGYNFDTAFPA
jgi:uncharacterized repeat protein (TIGR04138 family)